MKIRLAVIAVLTFLALGQNAAQAEELSAPAAEKALAQGATAWDLRSAATRGLPGARQVDESLLQAWLQRGDLESLQKAVSTAGLDLSRDVIVYGEPGDERAQALVASLRAVSPGRVHWLVGGAEEWSQSGRSLAQFTAHAPVPQHLVALEQEAGQMASASLRAVAPAQVLALR